MNTENNQNNEVIVRQISPQHSSVPSPVNKEHSDKKKDIIIGVLMIIIVILITLLLLQYCDEKKNNNGGNGACNTTNSTTTLPTKPTTLPTKPTSTITTTTTSTMTTSKTTKKTTTKKPTTKTTTKRITTTTKSTTKANVYTYRYTMPTTDTFSVTVYLNGKVLNANKVRLYATDGRLISLASTSSLTVSKIKLDMSKRPVVYITINDGTTKYRVTAA